MGSQLGCYSRLRGRGPEKFGNHCIMLREMYGGDQRNIENNYVRRSTFSFLDDGRSINESVPDNHNVAMHAAFGNVPNYLISFLTTKKLRLAVWSRAK